MMKLILRMNQKNQNVSSSVVPNILSAYMNSAKSARSIMFAANATGNVIPLYVVYKAEWGT